MNTASTADSAVTVIPTVDNALAKAGDLSADGIASLRAAYSPIYEALGPLVAQAAEVKPDQPKQARVVRLALREVRCQGENTRKRLKADILLRGKAIDGMQHVLEYATEPLERSLLEIEEAEVRAEAARKAKIQQERADELRPYADPTHMDLGSMAVEVWQMVLRGAKDEHQKKIDAEAAAKVERERQEREAQEQLARKLEADRIERERLMAENARREKELAELREQQRKDAAEAEARLAKERAEQKAKDDAAAAERKKQADALEAERKKREAAEAETKRLNDERIAKEKAEAAAKRKAARAPERTKLKELAVRIRLLELPSLSSDEGKALNHKIAEQIAKFASWVESEGEKL